MEITELEAIPIEVPLRSKEEPNGIAPYRTGTRISAGRTTVKSVTTAQRTIVRLHTDTGTTGHGEMITVFDPASTVSVIENELQPQVVGTSVADVESLTGDPSVYYMDWRPFVAAVEMAAYDALGKELGVSLSTLVGGTYRDTVECSYCYGIATENEAREAISSAHEQGFIAIKTKVGGGRPISHDVERIAAMHDEVDGAVDIRADAVTSWHVEDVLEFATELERRGVPLQYIEQPLPTDNMGAFRSLRERLRTPLAIKEDLFQPRSFLQFVSTDAVDVGVVDLVPAGGITAVKKLAGVAASADVSLAHHCGYDLGIKTAAILHLAASTPELSLPVDTVYYAFDDRIVEEPFEFDDGSLAVPEGPGLGVEVDEEALDELAVV